MALSEEKTMKKRIRNFLEKYKLLILVLTGTGIFIDVFFFDPTWDLVILFLTGSLVLSIWLYEFEGRVSVAGGLIFLTMCPFLLLLKKELIAEKAAIWAYMFLVVGIGQLFLEYEKHGGRG